MTTFTEKDLDFFIETEQNVLIKGKKGVGKTHLILAAFKRKGYSVLYLPGSTMDPHIDFVGLPRIIEVDGKPSHFEFIKRPELAADEIDVIFIDEFNRAPKAARNAVMELLQFKSINGHKLTRLKMIWTAINPLEDGEENYDVEDLDPAQLDRFQVHLTVPYEISLNYFKEKFGDTEAVVATSFWNALDDKVKNLVSPRRLDYALEGFKNGGDLRFYLPEECNPGKLQTALDSAPIFNTVRDLIEKKNFNKLKTLLKTANTRTLILDMFKVEESFEKDLGTYIYYCMPSEDRLKAVTSMNAAKFKTFTEELMNLPPDKAVESTFKAMDREDNTYVRNLLETWYPDRKVARELAEREEAKEKLREEEFYRQRDLAFKRENSSYGYGNYNAGTWYKSYDDNFHERESDLSGCINLLNAVHECIEQLIRTKPVSNCVTELNYLKNKTKKDTVTTKESARNIVYQNLLAQVYLFLKSTQLYNIGNKLETINLADILFLVKKTKDTNITNLTTDDIAKVTIMKVLRDSFVSTNHTLEAKMLIEIITYFTMKVEARFKGKYVDFTDLWYEYMDEELPKVVGLK